MDRIYGTLELRATNDELREFEGIANSAALDEHGTIIEPAGAKLKLPMPLLWKHKDEEPVGEITEARLVDGKWHVKGTIRKVSEEGFVKDLTDRAWHNVKYKLVRGLSIGFNILKQKGNRITEWILREISLVTLPSNQEASITSVRSAYLAASGEAPGRQVASDLPTTSSQGVSRLPTNPRPKMIITEQITQHENSRAAKVAQRDALLEKSAAEGRTFDDTEKEQFDTLDGEVTEIDGHLSRLASAKKEVEKRAVPVNGNGIEKASQSRSGVAAISVRSNTEPGIGFARYVMSLVACDGVRSEAANYARERWGDAGEEIAVQHRNALHTRAPVAPGTTVQATFAAPLVQVNFLNEFLELLRAQTLVERIPGLRRVPFNISMPAQTAGGTYKWVGEGKLKPVTNAQFASVILGMFKASGIIVLTEELVRSSAPSAELVVRNELRDGITRFLDLQFIDPAVAAVAATNPASITNGVAGTAASGTTEAAARADLRALTKTFVTNNLGLDGVVLLMNQAIAFGLGTVINAVGAPAFPGISASGGSILGIPVVTSNTITAAMGIIAVHAPSILLADEGGIEIDVSREASLHLDSAPTDPADATAVYTSLWQANLVGLRVERFISWGKARSTAVDRIHTVAYA